MKPLPVDQPEIEVASKWRCVVQVSILIFLNGNSSFIRLFVKENRLKIEMINIVD